MTGSAIVAVDTNFFLRAIVEATSPDTELQAEIARNLFRGSAAGEWMFATNVAVIAEVIYVLTAPRLYKMSPSEVVVNLIPLLSLPTCIVPGKRQVIAALERWQADPRNSFVDYLILEQGIAAGMPLATFDKRLQNAAGDFVWEYCVDSE